MSISQAADRYFSRFQANPSYIVENPAQDVSLIVVIPCFSEPDIHLTLQSLCACTKPLGSVEIIVVVNHSECATQEVKDFNERTFIDLQRFAESIQIPWMRIFPIYAPDLPKKHAGVGLARKIGMDEAVRRFSRCNAQHGIIAACDSDTVVQGNFFTAVERFFIEHPSCGVATIHFEHPLAGELPQSMYYAIAQYELHLRLYVHALESIGFIYPYHTVGSSMAVTAEAYCRQGGMNKRQAGEDFYFLQKMFQAERVGTIAETMLIPSSRVSNRVPFGTGHAMATLAESSNPLFFTYNPESYHVIRQIIELGASYMNMSYDDVSHIYSTFHLSFREFVHEQDFISKIFEISKNSSNSDMFTKRFFTWINAFFIFRFLNTAHISFFEKIPIVDAARVMLGVSNTLSVEELLQFLRKIQKQTRMY